MIDIHTHILPVDDGAKDFNDSLELINQELKEGIKTVVLTPHMNYLYNDVDKIKEAYEILKAHNLNINLLLGSEIRYYDNMVSDLNKGLLLTINNTKYVLVEFSLKNKDNITDGIYELIVSGYKPIVAHIERYSYLTKEEIIEIKRMGALIQVNAKSFEKKDYKKVLHFLLKNNYVDFVASDCHDVVYRNVDFNFAKEIVKKKYPNLYTKLFLTEYEFN